jgi:hypothetical protein
LFTKYAIDQVYNASPISPAGQHLVSNKRRNKKKEKTEKKGRSQNKLPIPSSKNRKGAKEKSKLVKTLIKFLHAHERP